MTRRERTYSLPAEGDPNSAENLLEMDPFGEGRLILPTFHGLVAVYPDTSTRDSRLSPVAITSFKVVDTEVNLDSAVSEHHELQLPYSDNTISFDFALLDYTDPQRNQYAYMLEGIDRDWVQCGALHYARYAKLDPGEYVFRVKGSNHDGVWNEAGTSLAVVIQPAYWQTWWFRLLGGLVVLGIAFALYRRKLTHLQREQRAQQDFSRQQIAFQEAERKRIAAELHDGLGQDLLIAANEIQEGLKETGPSTKRMQDISSLIAGSLRSAREIASNLHPHQLDRLGLSATIAGLARTLAKSSSIPVECTCAEVDGLLSREAELHLYRIIQEALSNAMRHAAPKHVCVTVERSDGFLRAVISDDGIGFDPAEFAHRTSPDTTGDIARGFGLASMAERTKIMGGTLSIDSARGSGTSIIIAIPYGHTHADTDR